MFALSVSTSTWETIWRIGILHNTWESKAFNQVPDSENEIHGDTVAQEFGFKGALVPGATVAAYLVHPVIEELGHEFLSRGTFSAKFLAPVYDDVDFRVETVKEAEGQYSAELSQAGHQPCASARIDLTPLDPNPPKLRGDELGDMEAERKPATPEVMRDLQGRGCKAFEDIWQEQHQMGTYLQDPSLMAHPFYKDKFANPAFLVGMSNFVFASNAQMNPWILVEAHCQNFEALAEGRKVLGEMEILKLFNRRGHDFADARINLFDTVSRVCFSSIRLRAIYKVRSAKTS